MAAIITWVMMYGTRCACEKNQTLMGLENTDPVLFFGFVCPMVSTMVQLMDTVEGGNLTMSRVLRCNLGATIINMRDAVRRDGVWSNEYLSEQADNRKLSEDVAATISRGVHWTVARILAMLCNKMNKDVPVFPNFSKWGYLTEKQEKQLRSNFNKFLHYDY